MACGDCRLCSGRIPFAASPLDLGFVLMVFGARLRSSVRRSESVSLSLNAKPACLSAIFASQTYIRDCIKMSKLNYRRAWFSGYK
jgi:hypothetical protein